MSLDTQEKILRACWKLLEGGPGATARMSDIAKAAGVSRQAVYLHYPNRAELLVATTRFIDGVSKVDDRLAASRTARGGLERLDAFIEAWGGYIPVIYGISSALMAMQHSDEAAGHAWADRMRALREGCEAAVRALEGDGMLRPDLDQQRGTDLLWTLLSVRNWEHLVGECGWPQADYIKEISRLARNALVAAP
jgi:AcrR family transcriptional regulator